LPYQQARKFKNKASKFESGIALFRKNRLLEFLNIFKKSKEKVSAMKHDAARTIVRSKLIDINKSFSKWRKINT